MIFIVDDPGFNRLPPRNRTSTPGGFSSRIRPGLLRSLNSGCSVYSFFHTNSGLAPVFLRMVLVAIFLYHGGQKTFGWFGGDGWQQTLEIMTASSGLGISAALAASAVIVEIAVVPLFFFGFLTRLGALAGCVLMAGALYYVHGGSSFTDLQVPLLVLACCLALLFGGAGSMSIDRKIAATILPPLRPGSLRLT